MVSALGTIFSVENAEEAGFVNLKQAISQTWSVATGLSLLVWYVYAPQCLATFAVMKKKQEIIVGHCWYFSTRYF